MRSLQTVAMGLVIVFLDIGSEGWDWVADPVGWILVLMGLAPAKERLPGYGWLAALAWGCLAVSVLTLAPNSIDSIAPALGWLFSVPTIGFAAVLCGSLGMVSDGSRAVWLRLLGGAFVVVAVLPLLVYLAGLDWLAVPAGVAAVVANIALVLSVWSAGSGEDEEEEEPQWRRDRAGRTEVVPPPERGSHRRRDQGFDAEAVKRRVRRERDQHAE